MNDPAYQERFEKMSKKEQEAELQKYMGNAHAPAPPTGETAAERESRRLICEAMWEAPEMVAGRGRFTTAFLRAARGRAIGKEGAEAVYAIGIRARKSGERSVGIAFKIEDGATRGRDAAALSILDRLGWLTARARRELAEFAAPPVVNAAGAVVGSIRAEVPIIRRDAPD